jgi:hypothetical protein
MMTMSTCGEMRALSGAEAGAQRAGGGFGSRWAHDEVCDEDAQLVVLVGQPRGQADGDRRAVVAVGVAVFLVVLARHLVRQHRVRLGDLDERVGRFLVVGVLVRVELQRHPPVRLLDLRRLGIALDPQHLERVERVHLLLLHRGQIIGQVQKEAPREDKADPAPAEELAQPLLAPHRVVPADLLLALPGEGGWRVSGPAGAAAADAGPSPGRLIRARAQRGARRTEASWRVQSTFERHSIVERNEYDMGTITCQERSSCARKRQVTGEGSAARTTTMTDIRNQ